MLGQLGSGINRGVHLRALAAGRSPRYADALSPFAALNLKWNPFGAPLRHERPALAVAEVDIDALAAFVARPGRAVQLMGQPGHGKTTHLFALHARFAGSALWLLREGEPPPAIADAPVVFVDEFQRLPTAARRELLGRRASFVFTTQTSQLAALSRAGVETRAVDLVGFDLVRLRRYVELRLEWARAGAGPLPKLPSGLLHTLAREHMGDVRAIERALYYWLQDELTDVGVHHHRS